MTDETVSDQKRFPDPEQCRTIYLGQSLGFTRCLVESPDGCEYAVRSVSGFHCYHPDRHTFGKANPLLMSLK